MRDAHDIGLRATIGEELLHRVRHLAERVDAAELTLVIGEAQDAFGAVVDAAPSVADERGDRRCHAGDGVDRARQFLDVDARIGGRDRHSRSFRNQVTLHRPAADVAARGWVTPAMLIDARRARGHATLIDARHGHTGHPAARYGSTIRASVAQHRYLLIADPL